MARVLVDLLGRSEDKLLLVTIEDLEKATGSRGIDVRLVGDVLHRAHKVIRTLGLDSSDSTAMELYNALRVNDNEDVLHNTSYVGMIIDKKCISFNAKDIAADEKVGARFEQRSLKHMQEALAQELAKRYMAKAGAYEVIVKRLLKSVKI